MSVEIVLSYKEMLLAAQAGACRQIENLKLHRAPAYGATDEQDWQCHIEGCMAELAVAKHFGLYWSGAFEFRGDDVGKLQVRGTRHTSGHLVLHPDDKDHALFVLVTGINGRYILRGQLRGAAGKQACYWGDKQNNGRPAFWVPQLRLEPLMWAA